MKRARAGRRAAPVETTAEEKAAIAEEALTDRRAAEVVVLDMRGVTTITDYFLICHGTSQLHIQSLAEAVREAFEEKGIRPFGAEGEREARWVLLDYGEVVVHVFSEEDREFYNLERLWSDAPQVMVSAPAQAEDGERADPE